MSLPLPTEEEGFFIREHVLIVIAMNILNRYIETLQNHESFCDPITDAINRSIDRANLEAVAIRKMFRRNGIKILSEEKNQEGIEIEYLCRGYTHTLKLLWSHVKAQTEVRVRRYLGEDMTRYLKKDLPEHMQMEAKYLTQKPPYTNLQITIPKQ